MGVNGHWYVEIEKQGWWRGSQHTWVNRYVLSGAQPAQGDAQVVISILQDIENRIYPNTAAGAGVGFVQGRAYPSGKGSYFASIGYNVSLAPSTATGFTGPTSGYGNLNNEATLESCVVVETRLQGLSSTGKPIFLRKYFRGFGANGGEITQGGALNPVDLGKITSTVAPWTSGMGPNNWVVIGSSGAQSAASPAPLQYLGNRQVPKGRKKKSVSTNLFLRTINLVEENPELGALALLDL